MKKLIAILMTVVMVIGLFAGCSSTGSGKKKQKVDYDDLKEINGEMFVATNSNWGETDGSSDYWASSTYRIYYDGTIEVTDVYNKSGKVSFSTTITDDEYKTIYDYGSSQKELKDTTSNGCDGDCWTFSFYDEEGEKTDIFKGYIEGEKEPQKIAEILGGYRIYSTDKGKS